ncbi:MAG TPA: methyltransferase domain-containing protein [Chloroflexia bacterium]|nr:methyltransferase domain-containing protein [Chloroflexia bacterium]
MTSNIWKPSLYNQNAIFSGIQAQDIITLLNPQEGEVILDIGCGTGRLTAAIAESGARSIGIDNSPNTIEAAQAAHPGLEFHLADTRYFHFPFSFDAIFSNTNLHREPDADEVVANIARALKPGGRLVVELEGRGNLQHLIRAAREAVQEILQFQIEPNWYFPSIGDYTYLLERHGLYPQSAVLFDHPTRLENGAEALRNWLKMFAGSLLENVPWEKTTPVYERIEEKLRDTLLLNGQWYIDYKRLRVVAVKE